MNSADGITKYENIESLLSSTDIIQGFAEEFNLTHQFKNVMKKQLDLLFIIDQDYSDSLLDAVKSSCAFYDQAMQEIKDPFDYKGVALTLHFVADNLYGLMKKVLSLGHHYYSDKRILKYFVRAGDSLQHYIDQNLFVEVDRLKLCEEHGTYNGISKKVN